MAAESGGVAPWSNIYYLDDVGEIKWRRLTVSEQFVAASPGDDDALLLGECALLVSKGVASIIDDNAPRKTLLVFYLMNDDTYIANTTETESGVWTPASCRENRVLTRCLFQALKRQLYRTLQQSNFLPLNDNLVYLGGLQGKGVDKAMSACQLNVMVWGNRVCVQVTARGVAVTPVFENNNVVQRTSKIVFTSPAGAPARLLYNSPHDVVTLSAGAVEAWRALHGALYTTARAPGPKENVGVQVALLSAGHLVASTAYPVARLLCWDPTPKQFAGSAQIWLNAIRHIFASQRPLFRGLKDSLQLPRTDDLPVNTVTPPRGGPAAKATPRLGSSTDLTAAKRAPSSVPLTATTEEVSRKRRGSDLEDLPPPKKPAPLTTVPTPVLAKPGAPTTPVSPRDSVQPYTPKGYSPAPPPMERGYPAAGGSAPATPMYSPSMAFPSPNVNSFVLPTAAPSTGYSPYGAPSAPSYAPVTQASPMSGLTPTYNVGGPSYTPGGAPSYLPGGGAAAPSYTPGSGVAPAYTPAGPSYTPNGPSFASFGSGSGYVPGGGSSGGYTPGGGGGGSGAYQPAPYAPRPLGLSGSMSNAPPAPTPWAPPPALDVRSTPMAGLTTGASFATERTTSIASTPHSAAAPVTAMGFVAGVPVAEPVADEDARMPDARDDGDDSDYSDVSGDDEIAAAGRGSMTTTLKPHLPAALQLTEDARVGVSSADGVETTTPFLGANWGTPHSPGMVGSPWAGMGTPRTPAGGTPGTGTPGIGTPGSMVGAGAAKDEQTLAAHLEAKNVFLSTNARAKRMLTLTMNEADLPSISAARRSVVASPMEEDHVVPQPGSQGTGSQSAAAAPPPTATQTTSTAAPRDAQAEAENNQWVSVELVRQQALNVYECCSGAGLGCDAEAYMATLNVLKPFALGDLVGSTPNPAPPVASPAHVAPGTPASAGLGMAMEYTTPAELDTGSPYYGTPRDSGGAVRGPALTPARCIHSVDGDDNVLESALDPLHAHIGTSSRAACVQQAAHLLSTHYRGLVGPVSAPPPPEGSTLSEVGLAAMGGVAVQLEVPQIVAGYSDDWVQLHPAVSRVWDKVKLEPYAPRKKVRYFIVCPQALTKVATEFCRNASAVFEAMRLGTHVPGDAAGEGDEARSHVWPYSLAGSTEMRLRSLHDICQSLGRHIATLGEDVHSVVYMVDGLGHATATRDCLLLSTVLVARAMDHVPKIKRNEFKTYPVPVVQLVPAHHVTQTQRLSAVLHALVCNVFAKCRDGAAAREGTYGIEDPELERGREQAALYRPMYVLAQSASQHADADPYMFTRSEENHVPLPYRPDRFLHVTYSSTDDGNFVAAVFTDARGELLHNMLVPTNEPLIEVLRQIWQRGTALMASATRTSARDRDMWRIVVARCGRLTEEEYSGWNRLVSAHQRSKARDDGGVRLLSVSVVEWEIARAMQYFAQFEVHAVHSVTPLFPTAPPAHFGILPIAFDEEDTLRSIDTLVSGFLATPVNPPLDNTSAAAQPIDAPADRRVSVLRAQLLVHTTLVTEDELVAPALADGSVQNTVAVTRCRGRNGSAWRDENPGDVLSSVLVHWYNLSWLAQTASCTLPTTCLALHMKVMRRMLRLAPIISTRAQVQSLL